MKLLAIETATDACSVALMVGDRMVERETLEPRAHAEQVLAMVRDCLEEAGNPLASLDAVVFGRGPGSFTGVRIATGVVQGLALGADLPVVPVSTLAAYAVAGWRAFQVPRVAVAVDARMGECYWGCFEISETGVASLVGEEVIAPPDRVAVPPADNWIGVGSAWETFPALTANLPKVQPAARSVLPRARDLLPTAARQLARGETVSADQALPVYLREKVAWQGGTSKN